MIPWLCTTIANCQPLRNQAKRKSELFSPRSPKKKSSDREITSQICKNCSRTLVSIGFVCYLLSYCVAFFNRECVGETRQVSKGFPPRKRGLRTLLVRSHQQDDSFPGVNITKPFSGPRSGKIKN